MTPGIANPSRFGYIGAVNKTLLWTLIVPGATALLLVGCQAVRAGYESAPYKVVRTDGKFELRDYPALKVVETPMQGSGTNADGSFMRLFKFISGNNAAKEKIAMTTPVFMSGNGSNATMAFVLPANLNQVPPPADGSLQVRELPAGTFAVLRFSGGRSSKNEAGALTRLQNRLMQEKLTSIGSPVYGYFDPPWTPGFLRRNEVMLRVEPAQ
jgi:DNA gyrase inhibitor GyrI